MEEKPACSYVSASRSIEYAVMFHAFSMQSPVTDRLHHRVLCGNSSVLRLSLPQQRIRTSLYEAYSLDSTCSLLSQPTAESIDTPIQSPEVVTQRNLMRIKIRPYVGTLSQSESSISTESELNQPSYLENFIHLFIKVTLQEFRIYAQIDTNLNRESSITEREKGILRFNGI